MEHLKEQLKAYYGKTEPREAFLQTLLTLEAPPAPIPAPTRRKKKLLFPIAAMLIAAIAVLGGGHYLMDALPISSNAPEVAPTAVADYQDDICYAEAAPTEADPALAPDIIPTAPTMPEIGSEAAAVEDPDPEPSAPAPKPEQGSSAETKPVSPPPSHAAPEPDPKPEPPDEEFPSIDAPAEDDPAPEPPVDDVPPYDTGEDNDPGNEDDPPTEPGEDDPDPPPTDPTDPPDGPEVDDPPIGSVTPEISAYYVNECGQHMVYLTNCDTGESSPVNLTPWVTENGYSGTHNLFGYSIMIELIPTSDGLNPSSGGSFYVSANVIF